MAPFVDLIIRIKNGYLSKKESVASPHSTFREAILKKLQQLGYIKEYQVEGDVKKTITIILSYEDGVGAMTDVKLFSKPGRRWYVSAKELRPVLGGLGYSFISTPKGILVDKEAKKQKVGGELLFQIW